MFYYVNFELKDKSGDSCIKNVVNKFHQKTSTNDEMKM